MNPDLSVIIPTLDEADTLPHLLGDLAAQQGVCFEVLVSDGGSADGTCENAEAALRHLQLAGKVLAGERGRGRQLNCGAAAARGEWLLFLHADSRLPDVESLARGLTLLREDGRQALAGRFPLCFENDVARHDFNYYLCEVKALTGFPCTIHGDQGFLLRAAFFRELGGFREDLAVLEDTHFAETVRRYGAWRLLPAKIVTSARRFVTEGYRARQTLNALLMNFAMIGWFEPLNHVPDVYRAQKQATRLDLAPFCRLLDGLLRELSWKDRVRIWYRTGGFVRDNAWQLALRRVSRQGFVAGLSPRQVPLEQVSRFRLWLDVLIGHSFGQLLAMTATWCWFKTLSRRNREGV